MIHKWITNPQVGWIFHFKGCSLEIVDVKVEGKDPHYNKIECKVLSVPDHDENHAGRKFVVGQPTHLYQFEFIEVAKEQWPDIIRAVAVSEPDRAVVRPPMRNRGSKGTIDFY